MQNADMTTEMERFSVRRTAITLLAALGAFAVLTASYATAELPAPVSAATVDTAVVAD